LLLKGSVLSANIGSYFKTLGSYLTDQKYEKLVHDSERLTEGLQQESDRMDDTASILVRDIEGNTWKFYADPKRFKKIHDLAIVSACGYREYSEKLRARWEETVPPATIAALPDSIKDMLSTLKADEASLDHDCTSKEATRILNHASKPPKKQ
jgi:hypothetical protein